MIPFIFVVPLIQLIILVNAATFDMKNIKTVIVDNDHSSLSRGLISKIQGSPFYIITEYSDNIKKSEEALLKNKAAIIINIPEHFERKLYNKDKAQVQLLINAVNSNEASLVYSYTSSIIAGYNKEIITELMGEMREMPIYSTNVITRFWFNKSLNYRIYMTPAVLVILVTIIGMILTALNIVREKEMGTLEQINVTPIKKHHFIIGKLVPFWIIALVELTVGLIVGVLLFNMPVIGNIFHLYIFASVYLIVALGLGLLFSTLAESQQQVMFIAFFFMLTFILMSGIFTPVESMPLWAQKINVINPFAYFIKVIRMVLLKGSTLKDVIHDVYNLLIYATIILSLAIWRYRKLA